MTLKQIRDNALRVIWVEEGNDCTPDYIWSDVTTAINSALQYIWLSPHAYFRQTEVTATVPSGGSVVLPDNLQEVHSPLWVASENNRELHRILDQSEFNQFYPRFMGKTEAEAIECGAKEATYYFIKSRNQDDEDNTNVTLMVTPKPSNNIDITFLATVEPRLFTEEEIENLTDVETIGIPHKYVETILLPMVRFFITRSHYFFEKDKLDMIRDDVGRAAAILGVANPDAGTRQFQDTALPPER